MQISTTALLGIVPAYLTATAAAQGSQGNGQTTRYWDCCKPSCGWPKKGNLVKGPVLTCDRGDNPLNDGGNTRESISLVSVCRSGCGVCVRATWRTQRSNLRNVGSGCDSGGSAFMCSSQEPFATNQTHSFGFA